MKRSNETSTGFDSAKTMLSLIILIVSSLWINLQQEVKENRIAIVDIQVSVARIETALGINPVLEKPQQDSGKLAVNSRL